MTPFPPLQALAPARFESPAILKKLNTASRALAELKGVALSIPHQGILINTLGLQEAKDSSAIENIVTTHDDLYRDAAFPESGGALAAKEVLRYRQALQRGFTEVAQGGTADLQPDHRYPAGAGAQQCRLPPLARHHSQGRHRARGLPAAAVRGRDHRADAGPGALHQ